MDDFDFVDVEGEEAAAAMAAAAASGSGDHRSARQMKKDLLAEGTTKILPISQLFAFRVL